MYISIIIRDVIIRSVKPNVETVFHLSKINLLLYYLIKLANENKS